MVDHRIRFVNDASIDNLLHKLRYGNRIPAILKGLSTSQVHHLVAGILGVGIGAVGLFMALRDSKSSYLKVPWKTEERASSKVMYTVAGLHNLGNNCFLNVILQALASCGCFRSFLQNVLDADDLETEGMAEKLPVTVALVSLLEELCIVREERIVLSPRKVMLEMGSYVSSFNLKRQQDAAEAFLLLLSSLEEEVLQCYVPHCGSLVDVPTSLCGVTSPMVHKEGQSECKRWQRWFFGQFDGIVGSILTCRCCLSQLSVDFEFFRCLPITPVLDKTTAMGDSCTLEGCLKHFTTAENIDNYRCDRCSHIAALKYLRLKPEENEILCIQLQRASMSISGDIIKIQDHISFPLVLDLFPFTAAGKEMILKTPEESILKQVEKHQTSMFHLNHFGMPQKLQLLPYVHSFMREDFSREDCLGDKLGRSTPVSSDDIGEPYSKANPSGSKGNFDYQYSGGSTCLQANVKVNVSRSFTPSSSHSYHLTSVVEHYGGTGSGHYAVYRRLMPEPHEGDSMEQLRTLDDCWAYISDHDVSMVSEETVLRAEASLLFYERIDLLR